MTLPALEIARPVEKDGPVILNIATRIELFTPEEVATIEELWNDYSSKGEGTSWYHFIVAYQDQQVVGYACYGERPLTIGTYDLYWIVVDPDTRRMGIGSMLLQQVEEEVRSRGGRLLIIETSGREQYAPTLRFYLANGYQLEATIRDFYGPGDDLMVFTKHLVV